MVSSLFLFFKSSFKLVFSIWYFFKSRHQFKDIIIFIKTHVNVLFLAFISKHHLFFGQVWFKIIPNFLVTADFLPKTTQMFNTTMHEMMV